MEKPIRVGELAPAFEAVAVFNEEFDKVILSDYLHKKYVVLFFYPFNFTKTKIV